MILKVFFISAILLAIAMLGIGLKMIVIKSSKKGDPHCDKETDFFPNAGCGCGAGFCQISTKKDK